MEFPKDLDVNHKVIFEGSVFFLKWVSGVGLGLWALGYAFLWGRQSSSQNSTLKKVNELALKERTMNSQAFIQVGDRLKSIEDRLNGLDKQIEDRLNGLGKQYQELSAKFDSSNSDVIAAITSLRGDLLGNQQATSSKTNANE